ncbi:MAG: hypothetical protein AB4352_04075 [Hormoscilla sp.]
MAIAQGLNCGQPYAIVHSYKGDRPLEIGNIYVTFGQGPGHGASNIFIFTDNLRMPCPYIILMSDRWELVTFSSGCGIKIVTF